MSKIRINISTQEANRQMLIIEEVKTYVQHQKAKLGRPLFYTAVTFGCPNVTAVGICNLLTINGFCKGTFV